MKIYFARHGQTDWNIQERLQGTTDIPLNAAGIKQAEQLAQALTDRNIKLKKVYSSKLDRARKTAQIVCDRCGMACETHGGLEYETLDGLQEMCFGIFEGHTWDEIGTLFPEPFEKWKAYKRYTAVPGGESYQLALERVFCALAGIPELGCALAGIPELGEALNSTFSDAPTSDESGERSGNSSDDAILIVTHGGILKAMLTVLKDVPFENNSALEVPNATPIELTAGELAEIKRKL